MELPKGDGDGMTTQQVLLEGGDVPWWRRGVAWRHDFATVSEPPARLAHFSGRHSCDLGHQSKQRSWLPNLEWEVS